MDHRGPLRLHGGLYILLIGRLLKKALIANKKRFHGLISREAVFYARIASCVYIYGVSRGSILACAAHLERVFKNVKINLGECAHIAISAAAVPAHGFESERASESKRRYSPLAIGS